MATPILMPAMDSAVEVATVARWLKAEGSAVQPGEPVAEIETDKAIVEVEAPAAGLLRRIQVLEGADAPPGAVLAIIAQAGETLPPVDQADGPSSSAPALGPDQRVESMNRMRRLIAARTARSMREAPHFYVTTEVDMTRATEFRRDFNDTLGRHARVSVNDIIVKACALTIGKFPAFNSYFDDNRLIGSPHVNIGIAVALDDGLIIPAVTDCQDRSLAGIALASKDLIQRAKDGALKPDEYGGGTFAVSNLGMYDVDSFTAIIYPPNAAVLAVGSIKEKPVVRDHQLAVGRLMKATLSIDHRVVDGAGGAQFLHELKRLLERPLSLLA